MKLKPPNLTPPPNSKVIRKGLILIKSVQRLPVNARLSVDAVRASPMLFQILAAVWMRDVVDLR